MTTSTPCNPAAKNQMLALLANQLRGAKSSLAFYERNIQLYETSPTTIPKGATEAAHNARLDNYIKAALAQVTRVGELDKRIADLKATPTTVDALKIRAIEAEAALANCKTQHEVEAAAHVATEARAAATAAELETTEAKLIPRNTLIAGAAALFALGRISR